MQGVLVLVQYGHVHVHGLVLLLQSVYEALLFLKPALQKVLPLPQPSHLLAATV